MVSCRDETERAPLSSLSTPWHEAIAAYFGQPPVDVGVGTSVGSEAAVAKYAEMTMVELGL